MGFFRRKKGVEADGLRFVEYVYVECFYTSHLVKDINAFVLIWFVMFPPI